MEWTNLIPPSMWREVLEEAVEMEEEPEHMDLQGYDIDPDMIKIARENARQAGVDHLIHFQVRDVADLRHNKKYGFSDYQSPLWGAPGGEEEPADPLPDIGRGLSAAGFLVHVCDYLL